MRCYRKALDLDSGDVFVWLRMGEEAIRRRLLWLARRSFATVSDRLPLAKIRLCQTLWLMDDRAAARDLYASLCQEHPSGLPLLREMMRLLPPVSNGVGARNGDDEVATPLSEEQYEQLDRLVRLKRMVTKERAERGGLEGEEKAVCLPVEFSQRSWLEVATRLFNLADCCFLGAKQVISAGPKKPRLSFSSSAPDPRVYLVPLPFEPTSTLIQLSSSQSLLDSNEDSTLSATPTLSIGSSSSPSFSITSLSSSSSTLPSSSASSVSSQRARRQRGSQGSSQEHFQETRTVVSYLLSVAESLPSIPEPLSSSTTSSQKRQISQQEAEFESQQNSCAVEEEEISRFIRRHGASFPHPRLSLTQAVRALFFDVLLAHRPDRILAHDRALKRLIVSKYELYQEHLLADLTPPHHLCLSNLYLDTCIQFQNSAQEVPQTALIMEAWNKSFHHLQQAIRTASSLQHQPEELDETLLLADWLQGWLFKVQNHPLNAALCWRRCESRMLQRASSTASIPLWHGSAADPLSMTRLRELLHDSNTDDRETLVKKGFLSDAFSEVLSLLEGADELSLLESYCAYRSQEALSGSLDQLVRLAALFLEAMLAVAEDVEQPTLTTAAAAAAPLWLSPRFDQALQVLTGLQQRFGASSYAQLQAVHPSYVRRLALTLAKMSASFSSPLPASSHRSQTFERLCCVAFQMHVCFVCPGASMQRFLD
ncbi:MAG: hypothetical protein Q8P67_11720, partial [archaeon]|nr:hypothetical protein [archaeon]